MFPHRWLTCYSWLIRIYLWVPRSYWILGLLGKMFAVCNLSCCRLPDQYRHDLIWCIFPVWRRYWVAIVNPDSGESFVDVYNEESLSSELTRHTPTILQLLRYSNCVSGIFGIVLVYNGAMSHIQSSVINSYITFVLPAVQGLQRYDYYNFFYHGTVIFNHELHFNYISTCVLIF